MLASLEAFLDVAHWLYPPEDLPRRVMMLKAVLDLQASGEDIKAAAARLRTTTRRLSDLVADPKFARSLLGIDVPGTIDDFAMGKARAALGSMLVGGLAERAFVQKYRAMMGTHELRLEDLSAEGTDTDYRVVNGGSRPVFRINIKFFGSAFRQAPDLVGLQPEDCFPLATYKVDQAIRKQDAEHLPFVFVVVGVHGLTGEVAGKAIPEDLVHFLALIRASRIERKRSVEDHIVRAVIDSGKHPSLQADITEIAKKIESAPWRVISARRADKLLRELLFERVYAVRIRSFAQAYRGAEVDMHFSISRDLTPLEDFFEKMRSAGVHGISVALERGTF